MKIADVVNQLRLLLPQLTDSFTTNVDVVSMTRTGTSIAVKCDDPHGFDEGEFVAITGADVRIPVNLSRVGTVGTCFTNTTHDLTKKANKSLQITFSGATESEFNGTFEAIQVVDENTITFIMTDAGPTAATGSPVIHEAAGPLKNYNTTVEIVSVPSTVEFTYEQEDDTIPDPSGTIQARGNPRIGGLASALDVIRLYEENPADDFWLYVVPEGVEASKDRNELSDASSNLSRGTEYIQQLIERVTVFVVIPATDDESGALSADKARDLFRPIARSLLFSVFDCGLANNTQGGTVQFERHVHVAFNGATYVHAYEFSRQYDLTYDDTTGDDLNVALRDLCVDMFPDLEDGTGLAKLPSQISLVDTPQVPDVVAWQGYAGQTFNDYFQSTNSTIGIANAWSLATWIRRNGITTNFMLCSVREQGVPEFWRDRINIDSDFEIRISDKDADVELDGLKLYFVRGLPSQGPSRDWEHFCLTWDGTDLLVYFNGVLLPDTDLGGVWVDKSEDDAITMSDSPRNITIGSNVDGQNEFGNTFVGKVFDWGLWSTVKSAADVTALYNGGNPIDARFTAGVLQHYYNFSTVGDRAKDLGGAAIPLDIDVEEELDGGFHTYTVDDFPGA